MFYLSLLRHDWKIPNMECLRYQCFYLCLQAIDVNPSFFPSNVIKWSSNKEKICHPIMVHIKWAELRSKIRSNLCSRKRQAALSLELSIYSFVELVSLAAVRQFLEHNITYLLICGSFPIVYFITAILRDRSCNQFSINKIIIQQFDRRKRIPQLMTSFPMNHENRT